MLPLLAACANHTRARFGAYDPVFTPFHPNGTLDLDAIDDYAAWTTRAGTHTIILGGSTGEWPSLTTDERIAALRRWRAALDRLPPAMSPHNQRVRIMFHAGDTAVVRAVELASRAQHLADSLLVVPPCIMKPATVGMLVRVLGLVSAAAPALPLHLYHYPALYGVDLDVPTLLRAAVTALPQLRGVKFISSNQTELALATEVAGGRFDIITTLGPAAGGRVGCGTAGGIVYTPAAPYLDAAVTARNATAAEARLSLLTHLLTHPGGKSGTRASARLFASLDLGPPRLPLAPVSRADFDAMRDGLRSGGFI